MMRGLILVMMLLPGAVVAQDITPERVDEFLAVMADNDCRMGNAKADEVMPGAGFHDRDETKAIAALLLSDGRASLIDGQLIVHGGSCGGLAPDYTTRERFLAAVAYNGCSMTAEASNELLPPLGIKRGEIKPLIGQMISMGEVSLSQDNQKVFMEQYLCEKFAGMAENISGGKMAAASARLAKTDAAKADERLRFLDYMQKSGCQITNEDLLAMIPHEGFDFDLVHKVISDLSDEGILHVSADNNDISIDPDHCG